MTAIAKQIDARMKAHNLSIMTLETKAGIKTHAVRNILTGKSKNPSAVNLQAIADVLGCSVKDLLAAPTVLQEEEAHHSIEDLLQEKYANLPLMRDCVTVIEEYIQQTKKTITTAQFLTCIREVYLHSLQKNPQKVNKDFAEWFVDLL